jgi:hypothetical protein
MSSVERLAVARRVQKLCHAVRFPRFAAGSSYEPYAVTLLEQRVEHFHGHELRDADLLVLRAGPLP